ncbi:MAG: Gfo/Idh/MocA family oxidoreductase [Acidobacteriota bacterium]
MTTPVLRVVIIGLGEAGATIHLPAFTGLSGVQVVGACDTDSGRRKDAADRWHVPVFDDVAVMLRDTHPDVVAIATPPESHASLCLQAVAAGAHVFCEKPFVCTVAEADVVIAAAATAGRSVAVNHEFREMPIFRAMIDAVRSGRDGDLLFAQAWQQTDLPPWKEAGWRGDLARRTLFEAGVHQLDVLMQLFGEVPESVQAATSSAGLDERDRDALVVATLQFSRGRLAVLTLNRLSKGEPQYFEARVDVSRASYRASFGGRARVSAGLFRSTTPHARVEFGRSGLAWREVGATRQIVSRNPSSPNVTATRQVITQALDAFRRGVPPPSDATGARGLIAVINACYESAASGRRVTIPV